MVEILELAGLGDAAGGSAATVLEAGGLVVLPRLGFALQPEESAFLTPEVLGGSSKNVSYDPARGAVGGARGETQGLEGLKRMLRRYAGHADAVIAALAPAYGPALQRRRTSFRPGAVDTRALSPRKDDRRLHVDAFPSAPVQGRRILRVFSNVNPRGESRIWRVGEANFAAFAREFAPRIRPRAAGAWLQAAGLTRGRRTAYDSAMLQLHDQAKLDDEWQARAPARTLAFPPGSTWAVYTDGVLHAAMSGQHAFEQTYLLPPSAMEEEGRSPLRILETLTGRALI
jgi:hypothetical protein